MLLARQEYLKAFFSNRTIIRAEIPDGGDSGLLRLEKGKLLCPAMKKGKAQAIPEDLPAAA